LPRSVNLFLSSKTDPLSFYMPTICHGFRWPQSAPCVDFLCGSEHPPKLHDAPTVFDCGADVSHLVTQVKVNAHGLEIEDTGAGVTNR
jgi:hypothetical protein